MLELVGFAGVVPAMSAAVALVLSRWLLPAELRRRYALTMSASLGLLVGYGLLPAWAPWQPTTYWHWIPYLGVTAGLVASLTLAAGIQWTERWLGCALLAGISAWYLVPSWSQLAEVRIWHVAALASYMLVIMLGVGPLTRRIPPDRMLAVLGAVSLALALTTAIAVSLRFGQVGTILAASLLGLAAAAWLVPASVHDLVLRAIIPWYAVLVGGMAYIGYVNPNPRLGGLALLPLAPLALWFVLFGPLAGRLPRDGWKGLLADAIVVLVPVLGAIGWVLFTTSGLGSGSSESW